MYAVVSAAEVALTLTQGDCVEAVDVVGEYNHDCAVCLTHHTGQSRMPPTTLLLKRKPTITYRSAYNRDQEIGHPKA